MAISRVQAEEALAGTDSLLRGVVESTAEPVFVKDLDGRYVLINGAGAEVIGRQPHEILGRTALDVFPAEVGRAIMADDAEVIASGETRTLEEVVPVDGTPRTFLATKSPYFDDAGQVAGVVGIARDITERKRAEERQSFLAQASALLDASLDVTETLQRIAWLSVPTVADVCVIDLLDEDGSISGVAVAAEDMQVAEELQELRRRYPIDPAGSHPVAEVLRAGESRIFPELEPIYEDIAQSEEHLAFARRARYRSAMVAPLRTRGRMLGAVSFVRRAESPRYGEADLELALDLGRRAATALDNARLYAREHRVAETLQRSLLPQRLPRVDGLELAARYLPGGDGINVGGDFYDVLELEGGGVGLAIGDVAGKGIRAATIMGQLRTALRVCAPEAAAPAAVVTRVRRAFQSIADGELATLLYLTLDPASGSLQYATAAHCPPILVRHGGDAELLWGGRSVPLAAMPAQSVSGASATLGPGDALVLYTDGLVERPGAAIDGGFDRLAAAAARGPADPELLADHLLAAMLSDAGRPDDVAVLVARRAPR